MSLWGGLETRKTVTSLSRTSLSSLLFTTGVEDASVSPEGSMSSTAVFAAIRNISSGVGQIPLHLYRRLDDRNRRSARDHYLFEMFHDRPNPEMTSQEFREWLTAQMLLHGSAFAEIEFAGGRPVALWPLFSRDVSMMQDKSGQMLYRVTSTKGSAVLSPKNILHLKGFSSGGVLGIPGLSRCSGAVGLGLTLERFARKFFSNGISPSGVLSHPGELGDDAQARLKKQVDDKNSGLDNAFRSLILEEGMTWTQIGVDPKSAQALESRTFAILDVCRIFDIPPHRLMELTRATFSNIGVQGEEYLKFTLDPHLRRWESRLWLDVIPEADKKEYFVEFLREGFLRLDFEKRMNGYSIALDRGVFTRNEVRAMENRNPIPGGDLAMVPMNMVIIGEDGKVVQSTVPEPEPEAPVEDPAADHPKNDGEK